MTERRPFEIAEELVQLLDWMQDNQVFNDRASLDRLEELHAALRPAWDFFFGEFPLINSTTYPPRVWYPRIRERAIAIRAHLKANPDWTPQTRRGLVQELGWIHPRLFDHVLPSIRHARETGRPTDWGRVTREATLFLENEIRQRTGLETQSRQDLGAAAFRVGGPLQFKTQAGWQEAWMHFVKGILGAFGNPGAHTIRSHSETFAMGVVGAVSTVLVRLDEEFDEPQ